MADCAGGAVQFRDVIGRVGGGRGGAACPVIQGSSQGAIVRRLLQSDLLRAPVPDLNT